MIVVNFYNGMETELKNDEGPVSENLKLFRHFYYSKMCNLIGLNGVTKEYVNSLTAPDFECTYIDVKSGGFAELHFERIEPKKPTEIAKAKIQQEQLETVEETETSTDKEALVESINKVIEETPDAPEVPEMTKALETSAPVKRGRGRPKKNK